MRARLRTQGLACQMTVGTRVRLGPVMLGLLRQAAVILWIGAMQHKLGSLPSGKVNSMSQACSSI